ncbi:STAS domain-containing protein [Atopobium deltae]|uniref:Anti-sigma factor antagonist n=1 Tax=Atopobium deltae TaxID=1393034 RepID=A0A133XW16_9ACTN|nr:STAS domain-containing protein [Atopobium deltae]KXB35135.1 STAS domain protein [Atopobium deltae]
MELAVSFTHTADTTTMVVSGEVDVSCADTLRNALTQTLANPDAKTIVVDLAQVSYIDSTGIGVLVGAAHKAADSQRHLTCVNPQKNVARVLTLLGVADELHVVTQD